MRAVPLLLATMLCCGLWSARALTLGSTTYLFLVWNLGLAWVPWILARGIDAAATRRRPLVVGALGVVWLLFFPNALYLVTDLVHLRARPPVPLWYDVALLTMCLVTGLFLALDSLRRVHVRAAAWLGRSAWLGVAVVCLLSGYGVYVGRFLRWNSWDAAVRPDVLIADLLARAHDPAHALRAGGVTVVFGAMLGVIYLLHVDAVEPERAAPPS